MKYIRTTKGIFNVGNYSYLSFYKDADRDIVLEVELAGYEDVVQLLEVLTPANIVLMAKKVRINMEDMSTFQMNRWTSCIALELNNRFSKFLNNEKLIVFDIEENIKDYIRSLDDQLELF